MPHTETTLGGASEGLLGLTLELGTKISHPKHSGRSSVQVSIGSSTLSSRPNASRAVMQPKWDTAARAVSSASDPPALLGFHPQQEQCYCPTWYLTRYSEATTMPLADPRQHTVESERGTQVLHPADCHPCGHYGQRVPAPVSTSQAWVSGASLCCTPCQDTVG